MNKENLSHSNGGASGPRINLRQLGLLLLLGALLLVQQQGWFGGSSGEDLSQSGLQERLMANPLVPTRHGSCRMDCREITLAEVQAVLRAGSVNEVKSKPGDSPCPSWAIEGITQDGQEVRIVFAECERETRIITAIDLNREYDCNCD